MKLWHLIVRDGGEFVIPANFKCTGAKTVFTKVLAMETDTIMTALDFHNLSSNKFMGTTVRMIISVPVLFVLLYPKKADHLMPYNLKYFSVSSNLHFFRFSPPASRRMRRRCHHMITFAEAFLARCSLFCE
ncbi:unnamed protein product [Caenorhabditis sp. 36 PRJEB53466]|nr:unnamed protein product [Caenorhabditis sp. 36 PRJEB53466]